MAVNEIHEGDIGTIFEVTLMDGDIVVDLSAATEVGEKKIIFLKPDGTTKEEKEAEFKSDGIDGIIQYTTVLDDLDQIGGWKIQAIVILPDGKWSSDIAKFKVHGNL